MKMELRNPYRLAELVCSEWSLHLALGNQAMLDAAYNCLSDKREFDDKTAVLELVGRADMQPFRLWLDEASAQKLSSLKAFVKQYFRCLARRTLPIQP